MSEHDPILLGGYLSGELDDEERRRCEEHLAECEQCRDEVAAAEGLVGALADLPPEAFLEGPPEGADLLLARTLRQVRDEAASDDRRSRTWRTVATAAAVVAAVVVGLAVGRGTGPSDQVAVPVTSTTAGPAGDSRTGSATDPATGVRMTATVTPAAGWSRINVAVVGVPGGERCRLMAVGRDGHREIAGSWLASAKGETDGTRLDGSAIVADVATVEVVNEAGRRFISVPV
jgi:predicted anti-sigma-YlaC factor YlaD